MKIKDYDELEVEYNDDDSIDENAEVINDEGYDFVDEENDDYYYETKSNNIFKVIIIALLCIIVLILTNPNENDFANYLVEKEIDIKGDGALGDLTEVTAVELVESFSGRYDCGVFSIYKSKVFDDSKYLGVAKNFIRLN